MELQLADVFLTCFARLGYLQLFSIMQNPTTHFSVQIVIMASNIAKARLRLLPQLTNVHIIWHQADHADNVESNKTISDVLVLPEIYVYLHSVRKFVMIAEMCRIVQCVLVRIMRS